MNIELAGMFLGSSRRGASSRLQIDCMSVKQPSAPRCALEQQPGRRQRASASGLGRRTPRRSSGGLRGQFVGASLGQLGSADGASPLGHCSSRTCRCPAGSHRSFSRGDCRHRDNVCASTPHNNGKPGLLMSGPGISVGNVRMKMLIAINCSIPASVASNRPVGTSTDKASGAS